MLDRLGRRLSGLVTRRRILVYATVVLLVVLAEYGFALLTGSGLLDRFGQVKGTDFVEFYTAGRLVAAGDGARLYQFVPPFDFPVQFAAEGRLLAPQLSNPNFAFVVPPFYALPFVPLAGLPYLQGYAVWFIFNVTLFIATLRLLRPHVALLRGPDRWLAFLVAGSFFPVLECLFDGQNAIVTLFLFALAYVELRRQQDAPAGIALGLALYKPQLVLTLALLLAVGRRWRALGGLAVAGAACVAASWAIVGPAGFGDYLAVSQTMPGWVYLPGWRTWNMHSLNSFFALLVADPPLARALTAVGSLAVLGATIVAWQRLVGRPGKDQATRFDLSFSLAILAIVLVSPHVFAYDLALLILPGLLLADAIVAGLVDSLALPTPWLRALLAIGFFTPLVSRFFALQLHVQVSVVVLAALFVAIWPLLVARGAAAPSSRTLVVMGEGR
jgi:hypothetical protein